MKAQANIRRSPATNIRGEYRVTSCTTLTTLTVQFCTFTLSVSTHICKYVGIGRSPQKMNIYIIFE